MALGQQFGLPVLKPLGAALGLHVNAVYGPGTQFIGVIGQAVLLAIGGEMVLHHKLSVGALIAFFLYLNRFFQPIQLLVQQYNSYQQGQASVTKLRILFQTDPTTPQEPDAEVLPPVEIGTRKAASPKTHLIARVSIESLDGVLVP